MGWVLPTRRQFVTQRLGVFQVGGVEAVCRELLISAENQ